MSAAAEGLSANLEQLKERQGNNTKCHTRPVSTKHRRRAITESPAVKADGVTDRAEGGEVLRRRLAERIRSGRLPVSREAAEDVRASGWARR